MEPIRALTWNVWWRFGGNWRERERGILETIRRVDPDIVGLQEVWADDGGNQAEALGSQLGLHAAFVEPGLPPVPQQPETPDQAGVRMGIGLLSRWPVAMADALPLPSEDRRLVALRATLEHPNGPLHVVVAATSWEPEKLGERALQVRAIRDLMLDPACDGRLPVLLLADLNADFTSPDLAELAESLTDAWGAVNDESTVDPRTLSAENRFAPREAELQFNRRIDHIMVRPGYPGGEVGVLSARIVRDEVDGLPPSDHYAVVADIA